MKLSLQGTGLGTLIPGACCFGLLNLLLGALGLTTFLAYVNKFGDFVFLPLFALFGTLFIKRLLMWKKFWVSYLLSLIIIGIMIYFMVFGLLSASLILGGVIVGLIILKVVKK